MFSLGKWPSIPRQAYYMLRLLGIDEEVAILLIDCPDRSWDWAWGLSANVTARSDYLIESPVARQSGSRGAPGVYSVENVFRGKKDLGDA